jgi:hypothetical protein
MAGAVALIQKIEVYRIQLAPAMRVHCFVHAFCAAPQISSRSARPMRHKPI